MKQEPQQPKINIPKKRNPLKELFPSLQRLSIELSKSKVKKSGSEILMEMRYGKD